MEGIIAENVTHSYRKPSGEIFAVLNDVSLQLMKGECVCLLGESGSGKSTMAKLLLGIEKPTRGTISVDGVDVTRFKKSQWKPYRKSVQGVFQDACGTLNPYRTVYQNMEEGLINLTEHSKSQRKEEIHHLMELFHMDKTMLKTPARKLSGGEQRRTSLVRALVLRPKYLILDEVTSGLDLISTKAVLSTLELYKERYGCSYMLITHDKSVAHEMADKIYIFHEGKLVSKGEKSGSD